jgi:RNA polymerase sigma factor (sigma-70 family)
MVIQDDTKIHWIRVYFERYESRLLRYSMRFVSEQAAREVVQEAFLKLWQIDASFTEQHVVQWLYTVCRNRCLDILKKDKNVTPMNETEFASPIDTAADFETRRRTELALQLVSHLPVKEREVIRLKFQENLSYQQISQITGLSVSHVGVMIHNTLLRLRQKMQNLETVGGKEAL